MALSFSHIQLYVHDLDRAMRFYQRVLGFTPGYVAPPEYAQLNNAALQFAIALHLAHDDKDVGGGAIPYLVSDQFDQAITHLREQKVEVAEPRREGNSPRFTTFKDSEGNDWGLQESSAH